MEPLVVLPAGIETRWASPENRKGERGKGGQANAGRKGAECIPVPAGGGQELIQVSGTSGMVRRIWIGINDMSARMLRGLRLDFYWDGANRPAVSAPLGDFFGTGLGRMAPFQSALFASPEGRSFNCYAPMPFRSGMRIVVTNESGVDLPWFYYTVEYTLGDAHGDDVLYFHACFRRESPTSLQKDYEILPKVRGAGRYVGTNLGVIVNKGLYSTTWWGEGEVKIYLDGDTDWPTLCGTGTEDYIGTAWGQGQFSQLYQGCHVADSEKMQYCFYRYHILEPIYFRHDVRVTIQQLGWWAPQHAPFFRELGQPLYRAGAGLQPTDLSEGQQTIGALFERQDDWSSCAYFYLDRPENDLEPVPCAEERLAGLG